MQSRVVIVGCLWAVGSMGCGGGAVAPTASEPTSGQEVAVAREIAEEPEDEPVAAPPPARGPGRLRVVNAVGGQESGGTVRVLDGSGRAVAEGQSGDTFTVDAGTYRLVGVVTDASVLVDTPTRESEDTVTVTAGQEQVARVVHPVSRVRLRVTQRGRPVASWRAELRRQAGQGEALEMRPSEEHVPITPGRYDAVIIIGAQRFEVSGVIFQGGATMDLPVDIE